MQKTCAVDEKHTESAEADGGPEESCDEGPGTDDARYSVQRRRLSELDQLLVLLVATAMVMVATVAVPASRERRRRVGAARNVGRHDAGLQE